MRSLSKSKWMEAVQSYVLYFFSTPCWGGCMRCFWKWWSTAGDSPTGVCLLGPYCPVYGVGALVFLLAFSRLMAKREPAWFRWEAGAGVPGRMIAATAIELATSYLLEALTGAWPWQTYRDYAINFEGRIALSPLHPLRLGGLLFLYVLQPLFHRLVHSLSPLGAPRGLHRRSGAAGCGLRRAVVPVMPPAALIKRGLTWSVLFCSSIIFSRYCWMRGNVSSLRSCSTLQASSEATSGVTPRRTKSLRGSCADRRHGWPLPTCFHSE